MNFNRVDRFNSTLKKNLAEIFVYEINNPLLKNINIVDVHITKDLKNAHIVFNTIHDKDEVVTQLSKTIGFIKKLLSNKMYLKRIPELKFIYVSDLD